MLNQREYVDDKKICQVANEIDFTTNDSRLIRSDK